jgi:hypothetical protein
MTRLLAWADDTTAGAANRHLWDQARVWAACAQPGDMNQVCARPEVGAGRHSKAARE